MSTSPSTTDDIRRVGVVGAGLMGSGIAEVCARAGLDVVVGETGPAAVEAGHRRITASLDRAVHRHKLTEAERDTTLRRIRFTTDLADMADRDVVMEAVAEDEQVKTEVFAALDTFLHTYNYHRCHTALGGQPPISRVNNPAGQYT